jgi:hypothetical protein
VTWLITPHTHRERETEGELNVRSGHLTTQRSARSTFGRRLQYVRLDIREGATCGQARRKCDKSNEVDILREDGTSLTLQMKRLY